MQPDLHAPRQLKDTQTAWPADLETIAGRADIAMVLRLVCTAMMRRYSFLIRRFGATSTLAASWDAEAAASIVSFDLDEADPFSLSCLVAGQRLAIVAWRPIVADGGDWWLGVADHHGNDRSGTADNDLLSGFAELIALQLGEAVPSSVGRARQPNPAFAPDDAARALIEAIPAAVAVIDADDRFVMWNLLYEELCGPIVPVLKVGLPFAEMMRVAAREWVKHPTLYDEDWIEARMALHRMASSAIDCQIADGRWMRIKERRLSTGGMIGLWTDISDSRAREGSLRQLFDINPMPMIVADRSDDRILAVNEQALDLYGYARHEFMRLTMADIDAAGARHVLRAIALDPDALGGNTPVWSLKRADGCLRQVEMTSRAFTFDDKPAELIVLRDITQQRAADAALRHTRAFLNSVVDAIPTSVYAKDMQNGGRYVLFNRACMELSGQDGDQAIGKSDWELFHPNQATRFVAQDQQALRAGVMQIFEETITRSSGEKRLIRTKKVPIADREGGAVRFVLGLADDITARRDLEAKLVRMAHHDPLTDLPNRILFQQRLEEALALSARTQAAVAIHYLDLDQFKAVNDTLGHAVGDALLKRVCQRLLSTVRQVDLVARLAGDEFAIIQTGVTGADEVVVLAERVVDLMGMPFDIDGHRLTIGVSIGIALGPRDGSDPSTLLKNADTALYRAKEDGRGLFRFFEASMNSRIQARRAFERDLRRALVDGEFEISYQPLVNLASGEIAGCEALLRWRHPERGYVSPAEFVPLAEETGLIVPLGLWVLRKACATAAAWPAHIRLSVNISPRQFRAPMFVDTIVSALRDSGLPPERLELEITESVLLVENAGNVAMLYRLREAGIGIALDDFGTGYSSLSYLRSFSFDRLKMDGSFVRDIGLNAESHVIIRAILGLAHSLGMKIVAEGIETEEQRDHLQTLRFDEGQGYLFSSPRSATEIDILIASAPFVLDDDGANRKTDLP
ncbi:EAL domain-containing protein [Lichenihabitans sp. PAMC28606]|uniref:EAL domain-containing protein n=1 Tax=Lichenihabitans sp. PAMC28606 TaxID=2880932 RepID=UPI001D0A1A02|nr:EAL domain-containing protein [Lichenihabitans sp. PAMC28606]UDL95766.1 EAL domain-containing protein [Lichenihabitans sp. PAMC28606]